MKTNNRLGIFAFLFAVYTKQELNKWDGIASNEQFLHMKFGSRIRGRIGWDRRRMVFSTAIL